MDVLPPDAGPVLVGLARAAIAAALRLESALPETGHAWLREPGASFVTLELSGHLRGCIGSLVAHRGLGDDVRHNAVAAALEDPRFYPLSTSEFPRTDIEVSVLSAPRAMSFTSQADALGQLRPGVDGVILTGRGRRATFLPQVWEELASPEEFIAHLLRKAGLASDFWDETVRLERYTVTAYEEAAPS